MKSLIEHPPSDTSYLIPRLKQIIDIVKRGVPQSVREEMMAVAGDGLERRGLIADGIAGLRAMWQKLLPDYRILCLSKSPAHAAMWYHYSQGYKGAVMEFDCNDELDSAWLAAKSITYPEALPDIYHADGYAKIMTARADLQPRMLIDIATLTKSPDWSYEKEWRVVSFKREHESGLSSDFHFNDKELLRVFCGPLMESTDRSELAELVAAYPNAQLVDVAIGMKREFLL